MNGPRARDASRPPPFRKMQPVVFNGPSHQGDHDSLRAQSQRAWAAHEKVRTYPASGRGDPLNDENGYNLKQFLQLSNVREAEMAAAYALVTESDGESGLRASRARAGGKALNEHPKT